MLNYIFKFFCRINFILMKFGRIWIRQTWRTFLISSSLAIFMVLFYGNVQFSFAFDEMTKFSSSSFNFRDRLPEYGESCLVPPRFSNRVNAFESIESFISKGGSSDIERTMPLSAEYKPVADKGHNKCPANTEQPNIRSEEMDSEDYHTVLLSTMPIWMMTIYWVLYGLYQAHNVANPPRGFLRRLH